MRKRDYMEETKHLSPKIFLNKVLAGTATGIIIGLIPNAVLGAILKYFSSCRSSFCRFRGSQICA